MTDTRQARPTREQEQKQARRRRGDVDTGMRRRLPVDESRLDHANFVYRWANDDAARMRELTEFDDYERVPEDKDTGVGGPTTVTVGAGDNGSLRGAVLLRKSRAYHEADKAKEQQRRDAQLAELRSGRPAQDMEAGGGLAEQHAYVPRHVEGEQTLDRRDGPYIP